MAKKQAPIEYVALKREVCPEVVKNVLEVKRLLQEGKVKSVSEATRRVNISRSVFYKYNKAVFTLAEVSAGDHVNVTIVAEVSPTLVSRLLSVMKTSGFKLVSITQSGVVQGVSHITLTLARTDRAQPIEEQVLPFYTVQGVRHVVV